MMRETLCRWRFRTAAGPRRRLFLKLATLLEGGVPVMAAVAELNRRRTVRHGSLDSEAMALSVWHVRLARGEPLWQAMAGWAGREEVMLVMAGEATGRLPAALTAAARVMAAKGSIALAVYSGLAYPLVLFCASLAVLYLFGVRVIPAIASAGLVAHWTGMAAFLVDLSGAVRAYFPVMAGLPMMLAVLFFLSLSRLTGRLRVVLDRFIPYSVYRVMQGATWLIALAALLESGMRLEVAISRLAQGASPWMGQRLMAALGGIRSGLDLPESLAAAGHGFPDDEIIDDLMVYCRFRHAPVAIARLADEWLTRAKRDIDAKMRAVFMVFLLLLGLLTLVMASGVLDMQQQISAAAQIVSNQP